MLLLLPAAFFANCRFSMRTKVRSIVISPLRGHKEKESNKGLKAGSSEPKSSTVLSRDLEGNKFQHEFLQTVPILDLHDGKADTK